MKSDWDAVIVGGGIGGLICGVYLARSGVKALIIEKESNCGGGHRLVKHKGYCVDKIYLVSHVTLLDVIKELGVDLDMCELPSFRIYSDRRFLPNVGLGDYETMAEVTKESRDISRKIVGLYEEIRNLQPADISRLKPTSIKDWAGTSLWPEIKETLVRDLLVRYVISRPEDVDFLSVGELASFFRGGGPSESARSVGRLYPCGSSVGGMAAIPETLVQAFLNCGGALVNGATVTEILTHDGHARGVAFRHGTGLSEEALAPVVISDAPVWEVPDLMDKRLLGADFIRNAQRQADFMSGCVTVACGLSRLPRKRVDGEVDDFSSFTRLMLDGGSRLGGSYMIPSIVSPAMAPEGKHLLVVIRMVPFAWTRQWSAVSQMAREQLETMREVYSDFDTVCEWSNIFLSQKLFPHHSLTTVPRPGVKSASVDGLYFVGDTAETGEGRPWCFDLAAYNGRRVAQMIAHKG